MDLFTSYSKGGVHDLRGFSSKCKNIFFKKISLLNGCFKCNIAKPSIGKSQKLLRLHKLDTIFMKLCSKTGRNIKHVQYVCTAETGADNHTFS